MLLLVILAGVLLLAGSWWLEDTAAGRSLAWHLLGPGGVVVIGAGIGGALLLTPAVWVVSLLSWRGRDADDRRIGRAHLSGFLAAGLLLVALILAPAFRADPRPRAVAMSAASDGSARPADDPAPLSRDAVMRIFLITLAGGAVAMTAITILHLRPDPPHDRA